VNCVMPRNGKFRSLFAEILQSWGLGKFSTQVPEALTTAVCISASHWAASAPGRWPAPFRRNPQLPLCVPGD
jgi:hypothetical protein